MSRTRQRLVTGASVLTLLSLTSPAWAQTAEPAPPAQSAAAAQAAPDEYADETEVEALVVTSSRKEPGAVVGDIPPELQLTPRDIRAYGVSNVSELITALSPQTTSGRGSGRPIILVNGQRIASFQEIRDFPTEAIMRVDILPEEVSLKYGYRADQRVINMVLRNRFRALTVEGAVKTPTQGEGEVFEAKANRLQIQRERRLMVDAKVSKTNDILESDRDIANTEGDANYRTLQPDSESVTLTAVLARPLKEGLSASLNGSLDASRNVSLLGLADGGNLNPVDPFALADPRALRRTADGFAAHAGGSLTGAYKGWMWSLTGNADHNDNLNKTDREVAGVSYRDKSRSVTLSADAELTANGVLMDLDAGAVSTTLKAGLATSNVETRALRAGVLSTGDLGRDTGSFQANIDVPLASRNKEVRAALGDLSANFNFAADELSDFGTLTAIGYGLNWSPIKPLRVIASVTDEENAPSIEQLGAPVLVTPGARVFDFVRGETVEVTRIEGGAPGLDAANRNIIKLGLTLKPFTETDLTINANWVRTETKDLVASFPSASNQIEAAFPERFIRDAEGRLLQIDSRPINFDRRETEELRWGFTWRKALTNNNAANAAGGANRGQGAGQRQGGDQPPQPPQDGPRPEGGGPRFGPGGGFGGPGGFGPRGGGGNLQLGVFHTLRLQDEIFIRPGAPTLDLLDGDALGNSGGQPRHQIDLQANASRNGLGVAMNARWQSGTTVEGSRLGDLEFEDLTTFNVRVFADLGAQPWARQNPWLRGARVSLSVDNVFDARQQVQTASGETPINFQPDYQDPLGRQVRISFRKLFFTPPPPAPRLPGATGQQRMPRP
ncbi:TonB-dependent receptor [Caulobacter segnis]|uniref:TonB-dependent receptor n=1 Tax=Caulobacter segnis TaxID=88688 RepID=UPI00240FC274|nr:TonB-dependent receptor [Caulobacter segnis]MDG2520227.1 TonB-dependent receptor [Caulobacter segnis]